MFCRGQLHTGNTSIILHARTPKSHKHKHSFLLPILYNALTIWPEVLLATQLTPLGFIDWHKSRANSIQRVPFDKKCICRVFSRLEHSDELFILQSDKGYKTAVRASRFPFVSRSISLQVGRLHTMRNAWHTIRYLHIFFVFYTLYISLSHVGFSHGKF